MFQVNGQNVVTSAGKTYHCLQPKSHQQNQASVQNQQQQHTSYYDTQQQQVNTTHNGCVNQNYIARYINHQQPQMLHPQNNGDHYYHPTTSYRQNQGGFRQQQTFQQPQNYYNPQQYQLNQNELQINNGLFVCVHYSLNINLHRF